METYITQEDFDKVRGNYGYLAHRFDAALRMFQMKRDEKKGSRGPRSYHFTREEFEDLSALIEDMDHRLKRMFMRRK